MAINTRKISGLPELNELSGSEYLMVAKDGKSYKVKTNLLTADIIKDIKQTVVEGDGAESPITITTSNGTDYTFTVKNGLKGSKGDKGDTGDKGETGNSGIALYNEGLDEVLDLIIDSLDDTEYTDAQLTRMILSAKQGAILNKKLDKLKEYYCTQEQYDIWVDENKIDNTAKYFILED